MKVVIAGSRDITDKDLVRAAIQACDFEITELIHGGCRGVDAIAHDLWEGIGPIKVFPADWKTYGRKAGPIRNREMAEYGEALLAIWDGKSRGTLNMIETMDAEEKPVNIYWTSKKAEAIGYPRLPWCGKISTMIFYDPQRTARILGIIPPEQSDSGTENPDP